MAVGARLRHFLVKVPQVAAPCSISLRHILMKVQSFSKFDMINRNHDKALFFGLYEKCTNNFKCCVTSDM